MTDDPPGAGMPEATEPGSPPPPAEPGSLPPPDPGAETLARAEADAAAEAAIDAQPSSADYSTAFSPRNVAVGLAIVAGLVALAARRRRRRHARADREDG
jgi:MYXO-CTERM domain-containing protein